MKIALIGSAPSSIRLAPFYDLSWQLWACSPGTYPFLPRCNKFFELHRWEPGVIGKPDTQKPWFSPEYVSWMAKQSCVVMVEPAPEIPNAVRLQREYLFDKYGHYFFTSSLAWMFAMAIEEILEARTKRSSMPDAGLISPLAFDQDAIGLWGVDMAATEEWAWQRPGCHFFIQIAQQLGIQIIVPPESDLLMPPPAYGLVEHSNKHIKSLARKNELEGRLAGARAAMQQAMREEAFLLGAIDATTYEMNTWMHEGDAYGCAFNLIFNQAVVHPPLMNPEEVRPENEWVSVKTTLTPVEPSATEAPKE